MVCFLDVSPQEAAKRGGFGNERYETQEFQAKVRTNYNHLMEDNWNVVDTDNLTLDEVFNKVKTFVEDVVARPDKGPIMKLWPKD
jgi:dTMP kinase